jgi:hypothetical protein
VLNFNHKGNFVPITISTDLILFMAVVLVLIGVLFQLEFEKLLATLSTGQTRKSTYNLTGLLETKQYEISGTES